jgi:hypothetical protein
MAEQLSLRPAKITPRFVPPQTKIRTRKASGGRGCRRGNWRGTRDAKQSREKRDSSLGISISSGEMDGRKDGDLVGFCERDLWPRVCWGLGVCHSCLCVFVLSQTAQQELITVVEKLPYYPLANIVPSFSVGVLVIDSHTFFFTVK